MKISANSMPKILLHNLTIPYRRSHPGLFYFDQNAIFFGEPGDIVVTRAPLNDQYCLFLEKIGCKKKEIECVSSQERLAGPVSIFEDRELAERVRTKIRERGGRWLFDYYMLTEWEERWSKLIGAPVKENSQLYYKFNNKSIFRAIAKRHGFQIPIGFEAQENTLDIALGTAKLFLRGFSEVVIKQNEGAAGLGSIRISYTEFVSRLLRLSPLLPGDFALGVLPRHSAGFVIEGWYRDVVFSPSVQIYIHTDGSPEIISSHIQLFFENRMTYRGCLSHHWFPDMVRDNLQKKSLQFARVLAKEGLRGNHLSFNAILLKDGRLLWTEINPRRVSSSYAFQIANRVGGDTGKGLWYILYRVRKEKWKGLTPEELLKKIRPLCFSPSSKSGIIPYDFGRLYDLGECYILSVAPNQSDAESIFQHVLSL